MKHFRQKIRWVLSLCFLLLLFTAFLIFREPPQKTALSFTVSGNGDGEQTLYPEFEGDQYTVFLPSYAGFESLRARCDSSARVVLDGEELNENTDLSRFLPDTDYTLTITEGARKQTFHLRFLQSANVASLCLDTQSGSMKRIHENKDKKETVSVRLIDTAGNTLYTGKKDSLKGRGNSTWSFDKKPYLLTLDKAQDLLGLGEGEKWVLLANAADPSGLKTKLIFDFANRLGLSSTPRCDYVDLYLNGSYAGLYLICEKVDHAYERVTDGTGFLCSIDERKGTFSTDANQKIAIEKALSDNTTQVERIAHLTQELEDSITQGADGADLTSALDLDSWVMRYLIEELFENADSTRFSSYFYYEDGLFYAGPLWDVDLTMGDNPQIQNPATFFACESWRSRNAYHPWHQWLNQNEAFAARLKELYASSAAPLIEDLIQHGIDDLSERTAAARNADGARWKGSPKDPEELKAYLYARKAFLDSAWIDGKTYRLVQIESAPNQGLINLSVPDGESLRQLPEGITVTELVKDPVWIDRDTQEALDLEKPVTKDCVFVLDAATLKAAAPKTGGLVAYLKLHKEVLFCFGTLGVLGLFLLVFFLADRRRSVKKRRARHGNDPK